MKKNKAGYIIKRKQITCYCGAYYFPHRKHGGKCVSCKHGVNWLGIYEGHPIGDFCPECAKLEGLQPEKSECESDWERNPGLK